MNKHFQRELEQLTRDVLVMGGLAETAMSRAFRAFVEADTKSARSVIDGDAEINAMELRIEEEVLKILSLYAPTARDLRYTVAAHKITNDLERVGDLAVNIAERAVEADADADRPGLSELTTMADRAREMFNACLDAFVTESRARAQGILKMDDGVDELLTSVYKHQRIFLDEDKTEVPFALRILSVAKNIERIADHATNIAEDVIYMVSGDVVKHQF